MYTAMKTHALHIVIIVFLLCMGNKPSCQATDVIENTSLQSRNNTHTTDSALNLSIPLTPKTNTISHFYPIHSSVDFSLYGMRLVADSNLLTHDVVFHASVLHKKDTEVLESSMMNVTGSCYAYRLLPHGVHFTKPAFLELAYNPFALPPGYLPEDIHTYYYDSIIGNWQQLPRITVDTTRHVVISATTHFTDFINAVIRTPDMPEVSAFVPTQMADIETPHPFSNMTIVEAPTANTYGSAEITYPISIPNGRNGLQPNVDLSYSSGGGPSIVGYGWSLPQPAITIDTRWGVPRYDTTYESEIYTLNGSQLVQKDDNEELKLPHQTHIRMPRHYGQTSFVVRDVTNKELIKRHMSSTKNYWWTVVDKQGTTYYYGKYAEDTYVNDSCILRDGNRNIAYWALAEVVNLHGNYIRYEYEKSNGNELYLKYIYYTGHRNAQGEVDLLPTYRIRVHYDDASTVFSDGRLGFIRETDQRICYIDVSCKEDTTYAPFVRYSLQNDSFDGMVCLTAINKYRMPQSKDSQCSYSIDLCIYPTDCGKDSLLLNCTSFSYHHSQELFDTTEYVIEENFTDFPNLSESRSSDWSVGGTLTVGLGEGVWNTNLSAGGNYNFSKSKGDLDMVLMDIDGDGLADKVYVKENHIYYRKQIALDTISYFAQEKNTGISAKSLNHEVSKTHSWGLQAGVAVPRDSIGANISGGQSITTTQTTSFFADVNGDGLPDYIDDNVVYFNRLNSHDDFYRHNNEYSITIDSTQCAPYFYYDGQVDASLDCYVDSVLIETYTADSVRYTNDTYNPDCAIICNYYLNGDYEFQDACEECLQTTPVYLDKYLNIITTVDIITTVNNNFCSAYHDYLNYNNASRVCPECLYLLTDDNGHDIESYLACAEMCYEADRMLYWELNGCCYDSHTCPTEECYDYSHDVRDDCYNECVYGYEVCDECIERCQEDIYDCNECKRENRCRGAIEDVSAFIQCYAFGYSDCDCYQALYDAEEICEQCLDICKFHPELCLNCMHHYCDPTSYEEIVFDQIENWKRNIRSTHPNALFIRDGWTVTAYDTVTVCPNPEESAPNMEAVRVWVAPRDGTINLMSNFRLLKDTGIERSQSRSADGVRYIIQHDSGVTNKNGTERLTAKKTYLIDQQNIFATDYQTHFKEYTPVEVQKGDILSFHLMSKSSHSFDNVNWTQDIYYTDLGRSYNSETDYICSDKTVFQYDTIGNATIECVTELQNVDTAILYIMRGNNVYSTHDLTATQATTITHTINNIQPDSLNAISFKLYATDPSKVQVRAKITFTCARGDSITKWMLPEVSFPQNADETHPEIYYELFGPLYKGWGQYAFNNKNNSMIIPLDSLYNAYRITNSIANNTNTTIYNNIHSVANVDSTNLPNNLDDLGNAFSQNSLYNPLTAAWIEMQADAEHYQWEAFGKVARIGRTLVSNTRNEYQMSSEVNTYDINNEDFEFYDNAIPIASPGTRTMTIRKTSKTNQWNLSWGVNVKFAGLGKSQSSGTYQLQTDYMDMNGDRYPDIVHQDAIQYTQPWGGLGETRNVDAHLHETTTTTSGTSFSGDFGKTVKDVGSVKNSRFTTSVSGSTGGGATLSNSKTSFMLMDVNSDGLPDRVYVDDDSTHIHLNIGYSFMPYRSIPLNGIESTRSVACSGNLNLSEGRQWESKMIEVLKKTDSVANNRTSKFQVSLSLGYSASTSTNTTQKKLIDLKGDGQLDLIERESNRLYVTPNIFHQTQSGQPSFNQAKKMIGYDIIQQSTSSNAGLNLALTGGYSWLQMLKICAGVQTTPINMSATQGTHDLIDMNGDGLADLVRVEQGKIHVRYNISGKDRLLKSVTNPTGNEILLDYILSAPSTEQPNRHMLLASVRNIDSTQNGIVPLMEKRISYADPHYNPSERMSYGYGCVSTYDLYPTSDEDTNLVYRKHVQHYQNQDYVEHGKLIYEAVLDSLDNLYTEYELGTIYYNKQGDETDNICQDTKLRIGKEAHIMRYYEGGDEPITTTKLYNYDQYHNVIKYENKGDSAISDDDLLANITYENSPTYLNKNLVSLPKTLLLNVSGQDMRRIIATYNQNGNLSKQVIFSMVHNNDSCVTDYVYDTFGLVSRALLPTNQTRQRASLDIVYDSLTHSLPSTITNQFGQKQQYTYMPQWQKPSAAIDPYGAYLLYKYDNGGRLLSVTAPQEDLVNKITISFHYGIIDANPQQLYVDTRTESEGDSTWQRSLYDARGMLLQVQKRRADGYVVNELKSYDCFGRITCSYMPCIVDNPTDKPIWNNSTPIASYGYDVLDRQTLIQWYDADHNASSTLYRIANDAWGKKRLQTIRIDEEGHAWQEFTTPQGWVTTSITPDGATTRFQYDALGQMIRSVDPDGLITTHTFDGMGRRVQRVHPDAGVMRWQYDPVGNLIATQTQRQINDGTHTAYHYTYSRLDSVCYPNHPEMNVVYEYDSIGGRVQIRKDMSGYEYFEYDDMGNVALSERLITLPTETNGYMFTTQYHYDSFGKIIRMEYPDGEILSYDYDNGLLNKVQGVHATASGTNTYKYIDTIHYDYEDRYDYLETGDGYYERNHYHPIRSWLTKKQLSFLSRIDIQYDPVGNIVSMEQSVGKVSDIGGRYTSLFAYDSQNRLVQADMLSDDFDSYYDYQMSYSPSGMICTKSCPSTSQQYWYGYCTNDNEHTINHQVRCIYDGFLGATTFFTWDADGQLRDVMRPCLGDVRHHWWNEAGQMVAMVDNEQCGYYGYNADGERMYKLTGQSVLEQYNAGEQHFQMFFNDAVLYVNPYMVVTPKGYTKHYYNGSRRIAAQVGDLNDLPNDILDNSGIVQERIQNARSYMDTLLTIEELQQADIENLFVTPDGEVLGQMQWVSQCYVEERTLQTAVHCEEDLLESLLIQLPYDSEYPASDIYYYHSDHLGSASWITKSSGEPVQYIHYMPYGELWKNQQRTPYNERFKFTGKERDEETGYDYFGARNYTSAASIWLSVDPLADKYPGISPYAYCNWNPVKYVDPDGRDTLHFDANGKYTHRVQSDGSHVGIWHRSNNSTREFRFQDPNDANRFITDKEYNNRLGEISANDWLLGIMPVSLSSVYKATRPSISDRLKGRYIAALSGTANGSMDYMRLNEPNYNMVKNAQQLLMLVDGIPLAQQPSNMGNMLWGLKMHRLGFSLPMCLIGAHAYTIFGGMTGKYPKIELDSFDDQCSIILGFMLWPGF